MDISYYMLGALGLLLAGLIIYLLVALVRYRGAVKRARAARAAEAEGEARYLSPNDAATVFPAVPEPTAEAPRAEGVVTPPAFDIPAVQRKREPEPAPGPEPQPQPAPQPEPELELGPLPVPPPVAPQAETSAAAAVEPLNLAGEFDQSDDFDDVAHAAPATLEGPLIAAAIEPASMAVPEVEQQAIPSIAHGVPEEAPAWQPEAAPAWHPEAMPAWQPAPPPAPIEASPLAPAAPEEMPSTQAPSPSTPVFATVPGYSLADELERLMEAASTAPQPLLTPDEHERVVTPEPAISEEATFEPPVEPVFPMPSVGQALSSVAPLPAPPLPEAEQPEPAAAEWESKLILEPEIPAPVEPPPPEPSAPMALEADPAPLTRPTPVESSPSAHDEPPASPAPVVDAQRPPERPTVPDYTLVAPVELHFTIGGSRIGVKPGTRSYAEFQRLAGILLDDLRAARGW